MRLSSVQCATRRRACFTMVLLLAASSVASSQSLRARIEEHHRLYVPTGEGRFATVVTLPGCSGVSLDSPLTDEGRPGDEGDRLFRTHYPRMAERLRDIGFAVLLVDYLAGEGVQNACSGEIALETIADYIAESVAFARTRSFVDANRIHIIGWSMGGRGLLEWIQTRTAGTLAADSVVAVYAGCRRSRSADPRLPRRELGVALLGLFSSRALAGELPDQAL